MEQYKQILSQYYSINACKITQQQGGWASLAYKVEATNHSNYFLKVYEKKRASTPKWTALIDSYIPIVLWLNQTSLKTKIISPIITNNQHNKCEDKDNIYILFDYIKGDTIAEKALTYPQIKQIAEIISELHKFGEKIPVPTAAIKEDFKAPFCDNLSYFITEGLQQLKIEIKNTIKPYTQLLKEAIKQLQLLATKLSVADISYVLCHTDIHNWNMIQAEDHLVLLDWEGLKLAPIEADLFSLIEEPYFEQFFTLYKKHHPSYTVNKIALSFYQLRRKIEDIWEFIEQLQYDELPKEAKTQAIHYLQNEIQGIKKINNSSDP